MIDQVTLLIILNTLGSFPAMTSLGYIITTIKHQSESAPYASFIHSARGGVDEGEGVIRTPTPGHGGSSKFKFIAKQRHRATIVCVTEERHGNTFSDKKQLSLKCS